MISLVDVGRSRPAKALLAVATISAETPEADGRVYPVVVRVLFAFMEDERDTTVPDALASVYVARSRFASRSLIYVGSASS